MTPYRNWHSNVSAPCQHYTLESAQGQHTLLGASAHPVPKEQDDAGKETHAELHEDGGEQQDVDEEGALEQGQESPLVVVVLVVCARPRSLEVLD